MAPGDPAVVLSRAGDRADHDRVQRHDRDREGGEPVDEARHADIIGCGYRCSRGAMF